MLKKSRGGRITSWFTCCPAKSSYASATAAHPKWPKMIFFGNTIYFISATYDIFCNFYTYAHTKPANFA